MKKTSLLVLFACLFVASYAQKLPLQWGFHLQGALTKPEFDKPELAEADQTFSFGAGAQAYLGITRRWVVSPGLAFRIVNSKQIDYTFHLPCEDNGQGGVDFKNAYLKADYQLSYLSLPINMRYRLWGEDNQMFLQLGGELSGLISDQQVFDVVDCDNNISRVESDVYAGNIPFLQASVNVGMGFEIQLQEKIRLFVMPTMNVFVTPFLKSGEANSRLFQLGLQTGMRF